MIKRVPVFLLWIVILLGSRVMCVYGKEIMSGIETSGQNVVTIKETKNENICEDQEQPEVTGSRREYGICLLIGLLALAVPMVVLIIATPKENKQK